MIDHKKFFILVECILAVLLIATMVRMFLEKSGDGRCQISVVIQNSDSSQWYSFKYGLKKAAEDHNVELSFVGTGGALTLEEEKKLIESEIDNGADAVIVQPVSGEEAEKMLQRIEKKVPVMLALCDAAQEDASGLPVTGPDNYEIGKALAEELLKDYGKNIEGKTFGFLSEDGDSQAVIAREKGVREILEGKGAEVSWSVSGSFAEEGEHSLKTLSRVDVVTALDDRSLAAAGKCSAENDLHGALVYGIGNSTEAVYYLDTEAVRCLIVPDGFHMGYQSLAELTESIGDYFYRAQSQTISYTILRRDNLFSEKNQELLFTLSQ